MRKLTTTITTAAAVLGMAGSAHAALGPAGTFQGEGTGSLQDPVDVAVANDGRVFVSDAGRNEIAVFDGSGRRLSTIGGPGSQPSSLATPFGLALIGGNVHVVDRGHNRVNVYSPAGTFIRNIGSAGVANGQFQAPTDVAGAADGTVLVTSQYRLSRFNQNGTFIYGRGGAGKAAGQFEGLHSVTAAPNGGIFTSETVNDRIQRFGNDFSFVEEWGGFPAVQGLAYDKATNTVLVSDVTKGSVEGYAPSGFGRGKLVDGLKAPGGVASDCRGSVYVVEITADRVSKFAEKGSTVARNLLRNPGFDAAAGVCEDVEGMATPDWTLAGAVRVMRYGGAQAPAAAVGDKLEGGENLLVGGAPGAPAGAEQIIDVSDQSVDIDDRRRKATLAGLIGGEAGDTEVVAVFRDAQNKELGAVKIAGSGQPVRKDASAAVPAGTRSVLVRVSLTSTAGRLAGRADQLALTMEAVRPEEAKTDPAKTDPAKTDGQDPVKATGREITAGVPRIASRRIGLKVSCGTGCKVRGSATLVLPSGKLIALGAVRERNGRLTYTVPRRHAAAARRAARAGQLEMELTLTAREGTTTVGSAEVVRTATR